MSIRIVFMGSPDFCCPVFPLWQSPIRWWVWSHNLIVPSGRGRELKAPPVKTLALALNIPIMQPEKLRTPEAMSQLQAWNPDLIVVVAFGQILRKDVLELPRYGCINVHASLLPRWRGAAPVNAAILAGDEEMGVTIMQMDVGLDTGPMLAKKSIRLMPNDTTGSVLGKLSTLGADLLLETLPEYLAGNLKPVPQPAEGATYAPMLKKEDGLLDFTRPALELERRIRAMNPWPGAWFEWKGNPLKVAKASVVSGGEGLVSGSRFIVEGRPAVMCADGVLVLDEVQPSGKKIMSGKAFLSGARDWETAA
ncbi:methionyl-tRNA formyltransferase [Candidatus Villigracilis proximus]|uniref:methionyl-tRNA formyltransferase n=1 Tax=Candidatus Villigracilis proximus TaxID=3140683 RepID=UPI0031ED1B7B